VAGHRVLLIDLDPKAHATIGLGCKPSGATRTLYDVFVNPREPISQAALASSLAGLTVVPGAASLGAAESDMRDYPGKELVLGEKLRAVAEDYDYCLIDCPPHLGFLMTCALVASDHAICPVQTQGYALEGLPRLFETIDVLRSRFRPCAVGTLGLVPTFVDDRVALCRQIQGQMRGLFGPLVLDTVIHRNVRLAECPGSGKPIFTHAPGSTPAREFRALADEVRSRLAAD